MPGGFARNTALGFLSGAAVSFSGLVASVVAARFLGPSGTGVLAYVVWCIVVAQALADLGFGLALQRFIPSLRAAGSDSAADGLIGALTRISLVAAIISGALLALWLQFPGNDSISGLERSSQGLLVAIAVCAFIASGAGASYMAYLKGEQNFDELARISSSSGIVRLLSTIVGAWLFGVAGALAAYIAANALPTLRFLRLTTKTPTVDADLRREVLRFTTTGWLAGVVGGLVWGRTEIAFLEHYSTIEIVGLFAVAAMVTDTAMQLPGLLLSALLPRFSEQHGRGAHDEINRTYTSITGGLALLIIPVCVGGAAIAPALVPLLFGKQFHDAVPAVMILLLASAVTGVGTTAVRLMNSTGRNGFLLFSNSLGLLGTIIFGLLLIPRFGLVGAACSRATVQILVVLLETCYVSRKLGSSLPYRALTLISLASICQGTSALAIVIWIGGPASLPLAICSAICIFLVLVRLFGVVRRIDPKLVTAVPEHLPNRGRHQLLMLWRFVAPG